MIEDFRDLLRELVKAECRFLVVGAHALTVHGVPRATVDLDIWVKNDEENASRVYQALANFGAPLDSLRVTEADFQSPDVVTQFGLPPYRIDVMTSVSGISFEEAWEDRVEAEVEGVSVPIIGRKSFVRNKLASGRKKDLGDLEMLGAQE
jgi:hypothetical protein